MPELYTTQKGSIVAEQKIENHDDLIKLCNTIISLIREKKTIIAIILAK